MRKKIVLVGLIAAFALTGIANANLLSNGDFALGSNGTVDPDTQALDWAHYWTAGWINREVHADGPYGDTNNFHYAIGNAGALDNSVYQDATGVAGVEYTLTADVFLENWWSPTAFIRIEFLDSTNALISSEETLIVANGFDEGVEQPWALRTVSGVAPVGTVVARAVLGVSSDGTSAGNGDGGGNARFDNADMLADFIDTDEDGLPDFWELAHGLDPNDDGSIDINNGAAGDPDIDELLNIDEFSLGTNPQIDDTDEDGLLDGFEVAFSNAPNPLIWDTDNDGLSDGGEVTNHLTNPIVADTDEDGLSDGDEVNLYGSNPLNKHSDTDGEDDGFEVFQGTDPLDPLSSTAALGLSVADGTLDGAYGDAVSTQTVNTAWEDNLDELNGAYAHIQNDRLFLMITGNMNTNWNSLEIFIDSSDAVTSNILDAAGNDNTDNMDGLVFDAGFSPDYHFNIRRGRWGGPTEQGFNMDVADLATKEVSSYDSALGGGNMEGAGVTGTGAVNASPIGIALNNSNTGGVVFGTDAANQANALAVTSGLELSIALSDLGNPYGEIRILAMVTTDSHATVGNQILGGLVAPQGELGTTSAVDFSALTGDQFFGFFSRHFPEPAIAAIQMVSGNTEVQLGVETLVEGYAYKVQDTTDLVHVNFADVPGSDFTASNTTTVITVPADAAQKFYRVVAP